jgi:hypothetical protein
MPDAAGLSTPDHALRACRTALEREFRLANEPRLDSVREPLRQLSEASKRTGIPPERMIVQLKSLLDSIPLFESLPAATRAAARSRLVQLAIKAYFPESARD